MRDIVTNALILDKEEVGEYDARITLFTEDLGKIVARARSIRKITSKLAAHLEPFIFSKVRLVEGKGEGAWSRMHVVDALRIRKFPGTQKISLLLKEMTLEGHADPGLWQVVKSEGDARAILEAMGFSPEFAHCEQCGAENPVYFLLREGAYYCKACMPSGLHPLQYVAFGQRVG